MFVIFCVNVHFEIMSINVPGYKQRLQLGLKMVARNIREQAKTFSRSLKAYSQRTVTMCVSTFVSPRAALLA